MFIDEANHIYIAMLMYNLIEYSNNIQILYQLFRSLEQLKRDEVPPNDSDLNINNSQSFTPKAGKTANAVVEIAL